MLVDSGALSNVVSVATWKELKREAIQYSSCASSDNKLFAYASDKALPMKGSFTCDVKCGHHKTQADFLVVEGEGVPLLGQHTATKLGVLKTGVDVAAVRDVSQGIYDQDQKLFEGVGKFNTHQVALHIDKKVKPVAQPHRRTPFNLCGKVEQKIQGVGGSRHN